MSPKGIRYKPCTHFMSAKAAPKTLHQVRNVAYFFAAWLGVQKGYIEKSANDRLWVEHQRKVRQQNVERQQALDSIKLMQQGVRVTTPGQLEGVPAELQQLAEAFTK
ncbi:hypothetical protein DPX39_110010100 [Trypanosoma brucei equiperdum]|uniref:Uncharacterized protein n=1 Tax=Trypanosoma brucei equiperdum TaxID=630700 RepID=A0A3L6KTB7_9TRYP|nr:hypothetical protein DPX39_110010100 [Trypanosoma brucei equiperdum]